MIFCPEEYDAGELSSKSKWRKSQRISMHFEVILNLRRAYHAYILEI
jgi:hypothetical protein